MEREIVLQLDHQLLRKLEKEAKAKGMTAEELLQKILEAHTRKPKLHPQVRRIAEKLGEQYLKQVEEQWRAKRAKTLGPKGRLLK